MAKQKRNAFDEAVSLFNQAKSGVGSFVERGRVTKPIGGTTPNFQQPMRVVQNFMSRPTAPNIGTSQPNFQAAQQFYRMQVQPRIQQLQTQAPKFIQNVGQQMQKMPDFQPPKLFNVPLTNPMFNSNEAIRSAGRTVERLSQRKFAQGGVGNAFEDIGNVASVLPIGRIAKVGKVLAPAVEREAMLALNYLKSYDKLTPSAQMEVLSRVNNIAKKVIPDVVGSKEVQKLAGTKPTEWRNVLAKFIEDRVVQSKNPSLNMGFSVKPLQKLKGSVVGDIQKGFEGGRKATETKTPLIQGAKTQLLDRLTPIFDFMKEGKNLATENNPYRKLRLLAGVGGKVEAYMMQKLSPILKAENQRLPDLSTLMVLDREKELIGRGLLRKRNLQGIEQGYNELKAKFGEQGFATLQQSAQGLRSVGNEMLERLFKSGIIDEASFNNIRKNNQFYAPMEAVEHIADNLEKGRFGGGSYNVASQDVIRGIGSYTGDVADPIEALVRKIPKIMALTEKNDAIKSLVNLRQQEAYKELITPLKGNFLPKGMGTINLFENGKNVRYAVPEVIEGAIKNLDAETANILVSLGSIQAKMLRAGATGLNIGFIPVNIVRDVQDALTTELTEKGAKAMFQFLASYPKAIFEAARKGPLWQEWAKSGGLMSTMTEQIFKQTPKTVAELAGKRNVIKTIINGPKSLIEFANRVGEQSTRLARFKSGVARGESLAEAAFKSRDISLDFAKAGNKIKVLNQVIPFLNAGIQGSEKLLRLYKNNPKAAVAYSSVLFGVPTVALYNYNNQFKDYQDIPDAEKQINWIIIARDRTPEEIASGEKIVGIKIPKGFLGRMTSNTIEASMEFLKQRDPSTFANSVLDSASAISPVGLPYNKEKLGQSLSGILPPWLQAGIEGVSNTNLYFGSNIVPQSLKRLPAKEQYRENTPGVYKMAGQVTGISPLIIENTINTTTGGLGRQLSTLLSGDLKGATVDQVTRRFSGVRGGKQADIAYEKVGKEKEYTALRNKRLREAYQDGNEAEFNKLIQGMTSQQVKSVLSYAEDQVANKKLAPEQRAYESLTKEEKRRLGEKQPDLQTKLNVIPQAGATETTGNTFRDNLAKDLAISELKTRVEMTGKPEWKDGVFGYMNENGNPATIDFATPVTPPKLTGYEDIDKVLTSKYSSRLTTEINNIIKLAELDQITYQQASELVASINAAKEQIKIKTAKAKKPKAIKPKKLPAPRKVTARTTTFKPTTFKIKTRKLKIRRLKISKYKPIK